MGLTAYLLRNSSLTSGMITVSSADSAYPKANMLNSIAAKVFRSSSTTTLTVDINFTTAVTLDALAIINHNFTNAATITITAGASSPPGTSISTPAWRQYDILSLFTSASYQYWRVAITDTNTDSLEFGELWPGVRTTLPRRYSYAQVKAIDRGDIHHQTQRGVHHNYRLFGRRARGYVFVPLTEAEAGEFETLDLAVGGRANPFVWIPDVADETELYFVRKQVSSLQEGSDNSFFAYRLDLLEESRGVAIEA